LVLLEHGFFALFVIAVELNKFFEVGVRSRGEPFGVATDSWT
jgi:hypothetical protein